MTVEIAGRQLTLSFTVNAVCDMERALDTPLYDLLKTNVSSLRALLWCGLLETPDKTTLARAGELLDEHVKKGGSLLRLSEKLAQALDDAGFFH